MCMYFWLWSYFIRGIVESQSSQRFPFPVLSLPIRGSEHASSCLPLRILGFYADKPIRVFLIRFSRCFTIPDESSNSCSCGPIKLFFRFDFYFLTSSKGSNFFLNVLVLDGLEPNWTPLILHRLHLFFLGLCNGLETRNVNTWCWFNSFFFFSAPLLRAIQWIIQAIRQSHIVCSGWGQKIVFSSSVQMLGSVFIVHIL